MLSLLGMQAVLAQLPVICSAMDFSMMRVAQELLYGTVTRYF